MQFAIYMMMNLFRIKTYSLKGCLITIQEITILKIYRYCFLEVKDGLK